MLCLVLYQSRAALTRQVGERNDAKDGLNQSIGCRMNPCPLTSPAGPLAGPLAIEWRNWTVRVWVRAASRPFKAASQMPIQDHLGPRVTLSVVLLFRFSRRRRACAGLRPSATGQRASSLLPFWLFSTPDNTTSSLWSDFFFWFSSVGVPHRHSRLRVVSF